MAARGEDPPAFYAARNSFTSYAPDPVIAQYPGVLESVADVYRRNIDHAPTQAVARAFGVKLCMASNYVDGRAARGTCHPPSKARNGHSNRETIIR